MNHLPSWQILVKRSHYKRKAGNTCLDPLFNRGRIRGRSKISGEPEIIWNWNFCKSYKWLKVTIDDVSYLFLSLVHKIGSWRRRTEAHSEHNQTSKMEPCMKIAELHLRCMTGFWIRFWGLYSSHAYINVLNESRVNRQLERHR